jgi:hypothetical protein
LAAGAQGLSPFISEKALMPKRTSTLVLILVNGLLIVCGIVVLEMIFGNWINPDNLNRLNLTRDKAFNYEVSKLYQTSDPVIHYRRDAFGLRGDFDKPSDISILTVGGSTTDQRYVTEGATWQNIIQQQFAAQGRRVVVANAGVDGQSSYGHSKNFDWWFPQIEGLQPRYILFYIGVNDFYKEAGNGYDALVTDPEDKSLGELFKENSAIMHLYRTLHGMYLVERKNIGHNSIDFDSEQWVSEPLQSNYPALMGIKLQEFQERLELLIDKTQHMGAIPIIATNPARYYRMVDDQLEGVANSPRYASYFSYDGVPLNGLDYYYMLRELYEVTLLTCNAHAIPCFDVAAEPIWTDQDFYDSVHMTPAGARKVGEYLHTRLSEIL